MSKIWSLFINENIKAIKKKSTIIVLLIAIASLFGAVGITKLAEFESQYLGEMYENDWKASLKQELEDIKSQLNSNVTYSSETIASLKAESEGIQFAIDNDINYREEYNYWRSIAIDDIIDKKIYLYMTNNQEDKYKTLEENIKKIENFVKQDNFDGYMDLKIEILKKQLENKEIDEEEYKAKEDTINLTRKYEIGKNKDSQKWKQDLINELNEINQTKKTGIDTYTGKTLDYKEMQELENTEKIDRYRLENNIPPVVTDIEVGNYRNFYNYLSGGFATFFVGILVIMLAGSAISGEIAKGTIKFWMMTPNKRWKILLSKILSVVFIMVISTIILSVLSYALGGIFFTEEANPYIYVQDGVVKVLNPISYQILNYLTYDIDIFVYAIFAIMLSVILRNSALSIGVSIALYSGANTVMQIVNLLIKADWIKFIPFNNMGLTDKIFKNVMTYTNMQITNEFLNNVPVAFSLAVLGVCCVLMLVTMFDSFNKRDIT